MSAIPWARLAIALLTITLGAGCGRPAPTEPSTESPLFPLGVASGDPTPDGAVLWTRYDGTEPLRLDVWEGDAEQPLPTFRDYEVVMKPGGFVHAPVTGLKPGTLYRYAFSVRGQTGSAFRSREGRFRTALAPGSLERLSIGATSCTNNGQPMEVLARAAEQRLDAFLFLGDTVYADPSRSLAEFRRKWTQNLSTPGYLALRSSTGMIATWDDHEFRNDWAGDPRDPELRANASQAFFEHTPLRRPAEAPDRIWRSLRWGATVELFVLDSRGERKPDTRLTPDAEYLSREQLAWLKQALAASPAVFKVILNSVPIGEFRDFFEVQMHDRWEGYPAQREELLRFIDEQPIPGVIWLSGDFHMASAGRVSSSGPGSRALEILAGPGANFSNPLAGKLRSAQFDFTAAGNNYVVLDLDPATRQVRVTFYDEDGTSFFSRMYTPTP